MPNKNSKKARRAAQGIGKDTKMVVRGFIVVSAATGRRIYLPAHPEGVSKAEADRLSDGLGIETKVVPFDQVTG